MKTLLFRSALFVSLIGLAACNDGSAENAGEKIDETMTDLENRVEDACEKAKEGLELKDQDC